jgi:apolipoprotein N-acyltransferase
VSLKKKLRSLLLCAVLSAALGVGAPIHPDEIEELLAQLHQPKVAQTLRQEEDQQDEEQDE